MAMKILISLQGQYLVAKNLIWAKNLQEVSLGDKIQVFKIWSKKNHGVGSNYFLIYTSLNWTKFQGPFLIEVKEFKANVLRLVLSLTWEILVKFSNSLYLGSRSSEWNTK